MNDEPITPENEEDDFIPKDDAAFDAWITNFTTYATAHAAELGLSPEQIAELNTVTENWNESYHASLRAQKLADATTEDLRKAFEALAPHLPTGPSGLPS